MSVRFVSFRFLNFTPNTIPATKTAPAKTTVNPDHEQWLTADQQIVSLLTTSLSENIAQLTIGYDTYKSIWDSLTRNFSQCSAVNASRLKLLDYFHHAKSISDSLAAINKLVPDKDLVLAMLYGLGPDYLMLRTTLTQGSFLPNLVCKLISLLLKLSKLIFRLLLLL